jgi:phospholysine phosphohistidine inorganic pyrophosphate phosphatase
MPLAYLFDLDGTLYTDAGAIPGGIQLLRELRRCRVPFRCVTNTTSKPRIRLLERLREYGYELEPEDLLTPLSVGVAIARSRGHRVVAPFVSEATLVDLEGLELVGGIVGRRNGGTAGPSYRPTAVIIGDLGEHWTYRLLQEAFDDLMAGAELIALSRDRYFQKGESLALDAGPFVAALEYATGKPATVAGKPSLEFFHAAVQSLGLPRGIAAREIAMVGDDLWSDVEGAQRAGYQGWLVRTGKYREDKLKESGVTPDRVLGSVAELLTTGA